MIFGLWDIDKLETVLAAYKDTVPVTLVSNSIIPLSLVLYFNGNLKLWIPTCCISTGEPWIKDEGPFCKSGNVSISFLVG